eukprot:2044701-Prymnesium_polylepis.1
MLLPFVVADGIAAPDGRSKSFDARGNGYGRSETAGALILGLESGDIATLMGSAVQSGGRGASLTAPNGTGQANTISLALDSAFVDADEVGCVQGQGLGSALADPIEVNAIIVALCKSRSSQLAIGCHKANMGHSEASSGMIGFLTALDVLQRRTAAANAQLRQLNPLL